MERKRKENSNNREREKERKRKKATTKYIQFSKKTLESSRKNELQTV